MKQGQSGEVAEEGFETTGLELSRSPVRHLTAADIPEELLDIIIGWVGASAEGGRIDASVTAALRSCSLVNAHWCRMCRPALWKGRKLKIRSWGQAREFRRYTLSGSSRFMPIVELVDELHVIQHYGDRRSWLHLLSLPIMAPKLKVGFLVLAGPLRQNFPRHLLDSPHWGIPTSLPLRRACPQLYRIELFMIHFNCAPDFIRLLSTLNTRRLTLRAITWKRPIVAAAGGDPVRRFRPLRSGIIELKFSGCSDEPTIVSYILQQRWAFGYLTESDLRPVCELCTGDWPVVAGKHLGIFYDDRQSE